MTIASSAPARVAPENGARLTRVQDAIMDDQKLWDIVSSGDLRPLSPEQRTAYYLFRCRQEGLNPASQPYTYMVMDGKGILYANKGAAEQLRKVHGITIVKSERLETEDGVIAFGVTVRDHTGREDYDIGAVPVGANATPIARVNAWKKALTQAKRRATFSICGSGILDESELEGIESPRYDGVTVGDGDPAVATWAQAQEQSKYPTEAELREMSKAEMGTHLKTLRKQLGWTADDLRRDVAASGKTMATQKGAIEVALTIQEYLREAQNEAVSDAEGDEPWDAIEGGVEAPEAADEAVEAEFEELTEEQAQD